MIEYKTRWTESQTELQQQLKLTKKESREFQLQKEQIEEELRELSDAVEIATLDKEMAEEKVNTFPSFIHYYSLFDNSIPVRGTSG